MLKGLKPAHIFPFFLVSVITDFVSSIYLIPKPHMTELNPVGAYLIEVGGLHSAGVFFLLYPLLLGGFFFWLWSCPKTMTLGRNMIIALTLIKITASINNFIIICGIHNQLIQTLGQTLVIGIVFTALTHGLLKDKQREQREKNLEKLPYPELLDDKH